jgi:hypothetical protein
MTDEPTTERVAARWRIPAAVAMVVAGVGVAAVIVGATVAGGTSTSPTAAAADARLVNAPSAAPSAVPGASQTPDQNGDGWTGPGGKDGDGRGMMGGGRMGGRGMFDDITITSITGSQIALKTADGWTRTIDASGATVEKDGKTATLADLQVGDQVRFQQTRNTDGTYKITEIAVVQPHVAGTVKAVDASTITITQQDGTTTKVQLTGSTTYRSDRQAADKSAVTVGAFVMVTGTLSADGTMTATTVDVMPAGANGGSGRMHGDDGTQPNASPGTNGQDQAPNGDGTPGGRHGADPNASPSPATNTDGA